MHLRTTLLVLAFITLLSVGGVGFFLTTHLTQTSWNVAQNHTEKTAELIQNKVSFFLKHSQNTSSALAKLPFIKNAFVSNSASINSINQLLKIFCQDFGASLCYLLDKDGTTKASSNHDQKNSIMGKNYGFRPYFKNAIGGSNSIYLALGVTTKKRGFYFGAPVIDDSGVTLGVAVIKYPVEVLEKELSSLEGIFTLLDTHGIVFASNQPTWLFHSLQDLTKKQASQIQRSRQFGSKLPPSVGLKHTENGLLRSPDDSIYLFSNQALPIPKGWRISYLFSANQVSSMLTQGVGGLPIKAVFVVLFLVIGLVVILLYHRAAQEIEARKEIENHLIESEEKYRLLFEKSEDPMWVIYDNVFMLANNSAAQVLGYDSADELKSIHPSQLSPLEQPDGESSFSKANRMIQTAYEKGYHRFEWDHQRKNGEVFPVEVSLTRIPFDNGDALYCVWRDISETKQNQKALEKARSDAEQANIAKSQFLATMSHEIRTPMTAVLGMSELLLDSDLDVEQKQQTKEIVQSGRNLLTIINDILDYSKISNGHMSLESHPFDLIQLAEETLSLVRTLATEKGINLILEQNIEQQQCGGIFSGDANRLRQVLINLLGNAIKFTSEGEVKLTIGCEPLADKQAKVKIGVIDTGIGISPEQQKHLFDPFIQADQNTTRKYGGTGLGLSISRSLVQLMDGDISVNSKADVGSEFIIDIILPILPDMRQQSRSLQPGNLPKLRGNILVVDDVRTNLIVAKGILGIMGLSVTTAENGKEAISAWQTEQFDLVLMDCFMPVMDGYETSRTIRDLETGAQHTPIIALTANTTMEDRTKCLNSGMDAVVTKPFQKRDLYTELRKYLPVQ